ncbi:DUF2017 family protein [uncultured Microbacterium sp.]|uniref:DUF2017 family protein n=1 Tax=uncultured Microbacterium sp. TaxID=191216 RepID=UPI0025F700E7|nr:DUF2017 family protein [uncultured Microbacterium sp.]
MTGGIALAWARIEGAHLVDLIDQFLELIQDTKIGADAALSRLTPAVYPDDDAASAEFAAATSADLLDRRAADARVVRAGIAPLLTGPPEETIDLRLSPAELEAWLRTLAALRLVIAGRLGVSGDDRHDPDDARFGVYDWLGYRLDVLVESAEEGDGEL